MGGGFVAALQPIVAFFAYNAATRILGAVLIDARLGQITRALRKR